MNSYLKASLLGLASGMRTLMAPALVSRSLSRAQPQSVTESKLAFLAKPQTTIVFTVLAAGELVGDKLPFIPSRLDARPLTGRLVMGSVCGAAVCLADGKPAGAGLLLGGLCAIAGAFGGYHLRQAADKATGIADPWIALVEDALAIGLCLAALSTSGKAAD